MLFTNLVFVFFFLPFFLLLFYLLPKKYRSFFLFVGSVVFYLYSGLFNANLFLTISILDFFFVLFFSSRKHRHLLLSILAFVNLGTLFFFKYQSSFVLPLGISFYMFHQIMYILDVRNKKMGVEKNLFSYLTYITCFPYVTMGPLISYSDIKKQLEDLSFSLDSFYSGLKRFLFGFSKKVLLADNLGILYQQVYSINHVSVSSCVFSLIVFALQLYLDFSSYTDMAIGIGKMLHLSLPENFDHPYLATNVSDFWRRWHMTLTSFLKNYVYIPLGGNRVSSLRHIFNLLVVWVLTGIWHGTTFNFLLWGLYYFFILLFEKYFLLKYLEKFPKIIQHFYTLILVLFGYSLFCITSPKELFTFYDHLFHSPICNSNLLFYLKENIILLLISIILCTRIPYFLIQKDTDCLAVSVINDLFLILLFFLSITYLLSGSYSPFLYNAF